MFRLAIIFLIALLAGAEAADAQNTPVFQSGLVNNGHASVFLQNGVIGDAGASAAGNLTELGITNTGTPFCINDIKGTAYHQLCVGALALGGGLLNYGQYGSAAILPFTIQASGPLVLNSQTQTIEAKNLPIVAQGNVQLCISPTTFILSIASSAGCGGGPPPTAQFLSLIGGGNILLVGGAGRIQLL